MTSADPAVLVPSLLACLFILISVGCGVAVLATMFRHQKSLLAVVSIPTLFVPAFVYGWIRSRDWQLSRIMVAWTASLVLWAVSAGFAANAFFVDGISGISVFGDNAPREKTIHEKKMEEQAEDIEEPEIELDFDD